MPSRHSAPSILPRFLLSVSLIATASHSATVTATVTDPGVTGFSYDNSRWTTVDIALAGTAGSPALLSFYSEGANGLRLMENAFTDAQGLYAGDMRLPAHLDQVVVVVRIGDREDTFTLPVVDGAIAYTD